MQTAFEELSKVEAALVSETEFLLSANAVGGITRDVAADMYRNVQSAGASREKIFGAGALSEIEHRAAILDLKAGNTSTVVKLIRQTPTNILENGKLRTVEDALAVDRWLTAEGISDKEQRNSVLRALR